MTAGYCQLCKGRLESNLRELGLPETAPAVALGQAMLIHLMRDHPEQGKQLAFVTGQFSAWLALFLLDYPPAAEGVPSVEDLRESLRAEWQEHITLEAPVNFVPTVPK